MGLELRSTSCPRPQWAFRSPLTHLRLRHLPLSTLPAPGPQHTSNHLLTPPTWMSAGISNAPGPNSLPGSSRGNPPPSAFLCLLWHGHPRGAWSSMRGTVIHTGHRRITPRVSSSLHRTSSPSANPANPPLAHTESILFPLSIMTGLVLGPLISRPHPCSGKQAGPPLPCWVHGRCSPRSL